MTLPEFIAKHRPRIARELSEATAFSKQYDNAWAKDVEGRYRSMEGGKALRGILALIGHGAASGAAPTKDAYELAGVIELLHATVLIHDDIMDRDDIRRGVPSVFAQYRELAPRFSDPEHVGMSLALCAGDVGLLQVGLRLGALSAKSTRAARAASLVMRCAIETGFGQMEDFALGTGIAAADEKAVLRMLTDKTAHYSCSMPLASGALLGGGSMQLAEQLEQLGEDLGLIFQIRDDELGLFGTTEQIGKPAGSDIREGKQTLFTIYLHEAVSTSERKRLDGIIGNHAATEQGFSYVRDLAREYGIDKKVGRLVARRERRASETIAYLSGISAEYRGLLTEVLTYVSARTS